MYNWQLLGAHYIWLVSSKKKLHFISIYLFFFERILLVFYRNSCLCNWHKYNWPISNIINCNEWYSIISQQSKHKIIKSNAESVESVWN